ncbi:hypothetical protein L226DRAFT_533500 [Lentinus tigrinus ALCF2SS1-7]|uniref:Uncharacterized protein n=1 Tax=Lentinus tigrinus ALCF2SS1-6 TaxID=1328759 RepID=A0A5C2SKN2_9APHY|nr:hypothetical protein L227DRAFT_571761 [Lentinus tigrinus ALCF2SS1-6]RPD76389.1 hypothetical protein L226DRAFT_533500 [Lentinus tigrinus ALCF2SS1-7]
MTSSSTHGAGAGAKVYKPPQEVPDPLEGLSVFLAGSIEMGKAELWQDKLTERLRDLPITILNPRRDGWDSTWEQRKSNPEFAYQVKWELDCQRRADVIAMYFSPDTKSPITLMELGLFASTGKLLVCCPDGFWRKGNVEIVCEEQKIPLTECWKDFVDQLVDKLKSLMHSQS